MSRGTRHKGRPDAFRNTGGSAGVAAKKTRRTGKFKRQTPPICGSIEQTREVLVRKRSKVEPQTNHPLSHEGNDRRVRCLIPKRKISTPASRGGSTHLARRAMPAVGSHVTVALQGMTPKARCGERHCRKVPCKHMTDILKSVACEINGQTRDRTGDTRIFSPVLYQLSYLPMYLALKTLAKWPFVVNQQPSPSRIFLRRDARHDTWSQANWSGRVVDTRALRLMMNRVGKLSVKGA